MERRRGRGVCWREGGECNGEREGNVMERGKGHFAGEKKT